MTLAERLSLLPRGASRNDVALVALWHFHESGHASASVSEVRNAIVAARAVKGARAANWSSVLPRLGAAVSSAQTNGQLRWTLSDSGIQQAHRLLAGGQREVTREADALDALKLKIREPDVRDYVDEAVVCLR